ncbi:MAG: hypothetical protein COT16_01330 [Elusimicrobia bacterium CG08_land_8_20_14_0_20_44_26]|nr:MAG: hypothetical protein COT16_01330 [Elusimicrobia bacterium CG08_land_8_20_14_0_20_44_26]
MLNCKIIINPTSGQGKGLFMPWLIKREFAVQDDDIVRTTCLKDAEDKAHYFASIGVNPIIVCGGDGILNAVLNGVMNVSGNVVIGYIPAGMTNVAANAIGIPQNFKLAIKTIKKGFTRKIDVGKITTPFESRYFISMADFGLIADLVRLAEGNAAIKRLFGKIAYYLIGLYKFIYKKRFFRVVHNGKYFDSFNLIFSNGKFWGGKFFWSEHISISDGSPDIFVFENMSSIKLFRIFILLVMRKKIREPVHLKGGKIEISADYEVPWQLDGEFMGWTSKATLEIIPKAAKFICKKERGRF